MALNEETRTQITDLLTRHPVVLFMKGTKLQPRCGFSATVVQILDGLGVEYRDVDVLADPALRDGIKEFGNWPTIPQLYYRGNLVGGCDIVREMDESGELAQALGVDLGRREPPDIQVSEKAAAAIREAAAQAGPGQQVRIAITAGGRNHDLLFDDARPTDLKVERHGVPFLFDPASARLAGGLSIDFVETPEGGGFSIENPNAPPRVRSLSVQELKARMDRGEPLRLYDVRTPQERGIAAIAGAVLLDDKARTSLEMLPKDTVLVFHCHHGQRSQAAAEHYIQKGFKNVWNLAGGIDAWSQHIDPGVRRY